MMDKISGNIVIGQSGGPTAVINSSVAGVYKAAKDMGVQKVYGMVHGIQGFLEKDLISLEDYLGNGINIEMLKRTPSAFLGTCRYKLPEHEGNEEIYEQIFRVMDEFGIEVFFYIGGNDSMDTVKMLSDYAAAHGRTQKFVGIPKTVDNDLPVTDHCPGYGSAAKYIAASLKEVIRDVESTGLANPTVLLVEIMGRNAGWLTAAAALAKGEDCSGVDAIYLPERVFDIDAFVEHIKEVAKDDKEYEINNDVKYYYIELEKFRKQNPDMTKRINHWLSFLDMERGELLEMACEKNDKVKRAVENYEVLTGDEEVKRLSEIRLMSNLEEKSALHCAREEGKKEGNRET